MPHYVVVLEGGVPIGVSAQQLGRLTEVMAVWVAELRAARVLVARGATEPGRFSTLLTSGDLLGCVVIAVDGDDDANAVAATCPPDGDVRFSVIRLTPEPMAAV